LLGSCVDGTSEGEELGLSVVLHFDTSLQASVHKLPHCG
jgi:hypothetical protein